MARKAFTLVELLVVIAIISLLISILAPSLNVAKDIAKQVVCSSNMAAVGKGFAIYGQVNADKYPPYTYNMKGGRPNIVDYFNCIERTMWATKVGDLDPVTLVQKWRGAGMLYRDKYVQSPTYYYCPAQMNSWFVLEEYTTNRTTGATVAWGTVDNWSNFVRVGYFFNGWGKWYADIPLANKWDIAGRTFSSMENDKLLMIDQAVFPWSNSVHTARGKENPTFNIMFPDGHVEPYTSSLIQDILLVSWGGALKTWATNQQGLVDGDNNDWHDDYYVITTGG